MPSDPISSFAALRNRLVVSGELVALTALRIGAGRDSNVIGNDLPVLRDALGAPFVPGASLKGAFRARVEALIRSVAPGQARDLHEIEEHMRETIAKLRDATDIQNLRRQGQVADADRRLSEAIWHQSTLIDLTFGAPWIAGRLFFKDALVDRTLWFDQFEIRNGVALNRDTETAEQGLLYDYEVVPANTRFSFSLVLENADDWQLGMVLLALQPWQRGEVQIGGFRSRGLGYVRLEQVERRYSEIREGNVDDLLHFLGYDTSATSDIVDEARAVHWYAAFRDELRRVTKTTA
jgi:CRISPR-associated RAMP protein (TIGR02581 family)